MKRFSDQELLSMAESFQLDPLFDVTIESRGPNNWAICRHNQCLDKNSDEWTYEGLSSSRTADFLNSTRFSSIHEAVDCYANWRKERFCIFAKAEADYRWHCFVWGKSGEEINRFWKAEHSERTRFGLWILVGPGFKVLDQKRYTGSDSVEYKDAIAEKYA